MATSMPEPETTSPEPPRPTGPPPAVRHRLPDDRMAITHKFRIANFEGFVTVGLYENGQPGEIFVRMAKQGSTIAGLMDAFATSVSIGLQHGAPLKTFVDKFAHMRFEPDGWTQNPDIGYAKSIQDYIFRWLDVRFQKGKQESLFPAAPEAIVLAHHRADAVTAAGDLAAAVDLGDSPTCKRCGIQMHRSGRCYSCPDCGSTSSGCS